MSNTNLAIDEIVDLHQTVYDVYFSQADSTGSGAIGALDASNFLKHSKLKPEILKNVWELADPTGKGYLDRQSFYIALKLIALSQSGQDATLENLNALAPAPKLGELSSNITSLITPDDPWYIKASARINFDKIFDSLSPINDKITGARVKPYLLNSALPVDILGKIWELSDLDQDGNLDREEFLISMQLVAKAREGTVLPDQLPPSLLPFKVRSSNLSNLNSPTSLSTSTLPYALAEIQKPWVVTIEEKAKSDIIFAQIDLEKKNCVTGGEVKDTFIKTGLSQMVLANIWNLCDIGSTGKLNSEQFALAMHFVNKKLATGLDCPPELSPEMVPPSLRKKNTAEITIESKELEELQLQVTELQREKLFYEQRASEHETFTRQKRTELSNLELEMESLFKTLQDREMKKLDEENKLIDLEDKLVKIDVELEDLKQKYGSEKSEIDNLRKQIFDMETAMKSKDNDYNRIQSELKRFTEEQAKIEAKLDSRKSTLNEMNINFTAATTEVSKNDRKVELLKSLQTNLNRLLKEYEVETIQDELKDVVKQLEEENVELNIQIRKAIEDTNNNLVFKEASIDFLSPEQDLTSGHQSIITNTVITKDVFEANFPMANNATATEDPFQAFDPFKDSANDPFKESINETDPFKDSMNSNDPFGSAPMTQKSTSDAFASDPFASSVVPESAPFGSGGGFEGDPFDNFLKKRETAAPPRPAPPAARAQTPSLKPTKTTPMTQRPQSSMDFTRNNRLDLFNDFNDPFAPTGAVTPQNQISDTKQDQFGAAPNWDAFGNNSKFEGETNKGDAWDPFG